MFHEPREDQSSHAPPPEPSPELRERVLQRCRQELHERVQVDRRRRSRWRWSLVGAAACLLLANIAGERQNDTRIAAILEGRSHALVAHRAAPVHRRSPYSRATLLAALLRDPDSL